MSNQKKQWKELRQRHQDNVDKAASGESFFNSVKNTVIAMHGQHKAEKQIAKEQLEEGAKQAGSALIGFIAGAKSAKNNEAEKDDTIGFKDGGPSKGDGPSDEQLLRNLDAAMERAGLNKSSQPDKSKGDDYEMG